MVDYFEELMREGNQEAEILDEIKTKKQQARDKDLREILNKSKLNKFELEQFMME